MSGKRGPTIYCSLSRPAYCLIDKFFRSGSHMSLHHHRIYLQSLKLITGDLNTARGRTVAARDKKSIHHRIPVELQTESHIHRNQMGLGSDYFRPIVGPTTYPPMRHRSHGVTCRFTCSPKEMPRLYHRSLNDSNVDVLFMG